MLEVVDALLATDEDFAVEGPFVPFVIKEAMFEYEGWVTAICSDILLIILWLRGRKLPKESLSLYFFFPYGGQDTLDFPKMEYTAILNCLTFAQ